MARGEQRGSFTAQDYIRLKKRALVLESELNRLRLAAEWRLLLSQFHRFHGISHLLIPGMAFGWGWRILRVLTHRGTRGKEVGNGKKGWVRTVLPTIASMAVREIPRWIRRARQARRFSQRNGRLLSAPRDANLKPEPTSLFSNK